MFDDAAHFFPPVVLPRLLRNKDEISARRNTGHQRQPPAVPSHDLDDEGAGVRRSSGLDEIDGIADSGERRVAADGGVGPG